MAANKMVLGIQTFGAGNCSSVEELEAKMQQLTEVLGNPGPDPGPGPRQPPNPGDPPEPVPPPDPVTPVYYTEEGDLITIIEGDIFIINTGGEGTQVFNFELTEDFSPASTTADAIIVEKDGSFGDSITVTDAVGAWAGKGPWSGSGFTGRGYRGWAALFGLDTYIIVSLEQPVLGYLVDVTPGATETDFTVVQVVSGDDLAPDSTVQQGTGIEPQELTTGTAWTVKDIHSMATPRTERCYVVWSWEDDAYVIVSIESSGDSIVALITSDIGAASATAVEISPGVGTAQPMKWDGVDKFVADGSSVDVINLSYTPVRANSSEPVSMIAVRNKDVYVLSWPDNRAIPGYAKTQMQIPYHAADTEDFQLDAEDCSG